MEKLVKDIVFICLFVGLQVSIFNLLTADGRLIALGNEKEHQQDAIDTVLSAQSAKELVLSHPWILSYESLPPDFRQALVDSLKE